MMLNDRITLKPTALEVSRLNTWLDKKVAESGLETSLAGDLKLCLNEVLANLIFYGFQHTIDPSAEVEVCLKPDSGSAVVTDNGAFFDLRDWQSPKNRDLMTGDAGGFGINLIKERASRIDYQRVGDLNKLRIVCEKPSREIV